MVKRNIHIEIVRSQIMELSSLSQKSCDAIFKVLTKHFSNVGVSIVNDLRDLEGLVSKQPDLVFLGMEFIPNDSGIIWLADYLDSFGIAYTGSNKAAHKLERNKDLAKQRVLDSGLNTSPFILINQDQPIDNLELPIAYPLFVKPANRGGGLGIDSDSVVQDLDQLQKKVNYISNNLESDSLVEQYLPGREFTIAILKDELSDHYDAMPLELVAPVDTNGSRLLSSEIKSLDCEVVLEVTDNDIKDKITKLALDIFEALGARDYGRIDIRMDQMNTPHFLEANLLPSLISGYGNFPKACGLNINLGYEPMILRIVNLGIARIQQDIIEYPEIFVSEDPFLVTPKVILDTV